MMSLDITDKQRFLSMALPGTPWGSVPPSPEVAEMHDREAVELLCSLDIDAERHERIIQLCQWYCDTWPEGQMLTPAALALFHYSIMVMQMTKEQR